MFPSLCVLVVRCGIEVAFGKVGLEIVYGVVVTGFTTMCDIDAAVVGIRLCLIHSPHRSSETS